MSETLPVFLQGTDGEKRVAIRRSWLVSAAGMVFVLLCILSLPQDDVVNTWRAYTTVPSPFEAAKNRTLGFANIYAITTNTTWRVQGLKAAANVTHIDVELFHPRQVPEEEVQKFRTSVESHEIGRGKALAWLAHLDMIQHIIDEGLETALIVEDDVDWDVYLREQMFHVSRAFGSRQAILEGNKDPTATSADAAYPYGMKWDLLWIGHNFDDMNGLEDREQYMWHDTTVPEEKQYVGITPWFSRIPPSHRALWVVLPDDELRFADAVTGSGPMDLSRPMRTRSRPMEPGSLSKPLRRWATSVPLKPSTCGWPASVMTRYWTA